MKKLLLIVLSSIVLFPGCKKDLTGLALEQEFDLKPGQSAFVSDGVSDQPIEIKFNKVLEDSRCPEGANCIWAGQFRAELEIQKSELIEVIEAKENKTPNYRDFRISILRAAPYPKNSDKRRPDYTLRMVVN